MLSNMRMTFVANTVVNEEVIANFVAVLNMDNLELAFSERHVDKEACKAFRDIVRGDRRDFEDHVYSIQDHLKGE